MHTHQRAYTHIKRDMTLRSKSHICSAKSNGSLGVSNMSSWLCIHTHIKGHTHTHERGHDYVIKERPSLNLETLASVFPNWEILNWETSIERENLPVEVSQHSQLRQGWDLFETNAQIQWNPVYNAFHRIVLVETNKVVRSNSNVILTWQTRSRRSSRVAESTRRALASYFPIRIWYVFLTSICRGKADACVCISRYFGTYSL